MTQTTRCDNDNCGEVLEHDGQGRGIPVSRGGLTFCSMDCRHEYQREEIHRILREWRDN
jgi:hypothetical protein